MVAAGRMGETLAISIVFKTSSQTGSVRERGRAGWMGWGGGVGGQAGGRAGAVSSTAWATRGRPELEAPAAPEGAECEGSFGTGGNRGPLYKRSASATRCRCSGVFAWTKTS